VGKRHIEKNFKNPLKIKPETASLLQDDYRITTGQLQDLAVIKPLVSRQSAWKWSSRRELCDKR